MLYFVVIILSIVCIVCFQFHSYCCYDDVLFHLFSFSGKGGEMIKMLQERAGCKMQMIQDGPYAATPEKPLRMTGFPENCKVNTTHTHTHTYIPFIGY